jgi:Fic family protein
MLKSIGLIEGAKEVIENAPLVPSFEKQFQSDAIIRTVYHGTHIEGNDLTLSQTKRLLEGQDVFARPRDIQEVVNYRNVMTLLEELRHKRGEHKVQDLLDIHKAVVTKIVADDKIGIFRTTQVVIREEGTGKVIFTPPAPVEVPYLIQGFFEWLNSEESKEIHPILRAGIAHYVLVTIHPFIEGNGRTVRAFTSLLLIKENYDIKRFFALEEHFDQDLEAYYQAFFAVDSQQGSIAERNLTPWLEYFVDVVAVEVVKIKERVRQLSIDTRLKIKIGEQVALSERQMRVVEFVSDQGSALMKDLKKILPMVSEDTILRDLKDLLEKKIIKKEGATKAAKYVLATKR